MNKQWRKPRRANGCCSLLETSWGGVDPSGGSVSRKPEVIRGSPRGRAAHLIAENEGERKLPCLEIRAGDVPPRRSSQGKPSLVQTGYTESRNRRGQAECSWFCGLPMVQLDSPPAFLHKFLLNTVCSAPLLTPFEPKSSSLSLLFQPSKFPSSSLLLNPASFVSLMSSLVSI